ncbi:response regulator [Marinomonas rhizomae]|uniref:Response regulator receiver modulated metal dependent phosphohydrolase n=1 Tax=Marinomonas rhizomae TaxID=491948 RepID=A0A366JBK4_9GAMM|nr:HD domain-containing phosphohydrolase [Marinomonas rhizomae]RBP83800.1 response regulator receiver modulated metal dependent phosphohydrolase [Marinomonas rhizomae]RNF73488.1 response regulator [Marinomonas rhizomae]
MTNISNLYPVDDTQQASILLVDDTPENIDLLAASLRDDYQLKVALSGARALAIAQDKDMPKPDLILLDVMMPEMDGYEVCSRLKADPTTAHIPVIFVTAKHDAGDEEYGFDLGAVDYITKPFTPRLVRARVRTHLALHNQNQQLFKQVQERTQALQDSKIRIIQHLGRAVEYKDNETGAHVIRMSHITRLLAEHIVNDQAWVERIFQAAPMHDVGKIGISDDILRKPGKLTPEEWVQMKHHPLIGAQILESDDDPLLLMASVISLTHHEKWDGSGYPNNLMADQIPLEGRIVAIADVIDALMSKRPYKEPWTTEQTIEYVDEQKGKHFDPGLADLAIKLMPHIVEIRALYPDEPSDPLGYSFFKLAH